MRKKTYLKFLILIILACAFFILGVGIESKALFSNLTGIASWYSEFSPGIKKTTANMETFDHDKMTCAMWGIPFNTQVEVTNIANDKKVLVRVNDRGPAKRLCRKGRIIDLTMAAFKKIETLSTGLANVRIRIIKTQE
ncbi:MAG: septal ring lytic transglycosylase RlpA family protein [Candidatus Omnitrophota bacterium]|nr:septal ring lytic transglycosylase RlpA family protein [Candidatus Omnitrophota bacterium]MBU1894542.1 septal ring lytic transglycosylase RlpA family protein [Candidatus Omnitrophota bacterium]